MDNEGKLDKQETSYDDILEGMCLPVKELASIASNSSNNNNNNND
jgi:hypothetical protein